MLTSLAWGTLSLISRMRPCAQRTLFLLPSLGSFSPPNAAKEAAGMAQALSQEVSGLGVTVAMLRFSACHLGTGAV